MSDQYVGEIRMFAGNFAPVDWATCDGQLLSIAQYSELYALIGTTYGGDGVRTFALPDLRGRIPVHMAANYPLGMSGGMEKVTLLPQQLPGHSHTPQVNPNAGNSTDPTGQFWSTSEQRYFSNDVTQNLVQMSAQAITQSGGNQPHDNMMPSLAVNFIIALTGYFPSQG